MPRDPNAHDGGAKTTLNKVLIFLGADDDYTFVPNIITDDGITRRTWRRKFSHPNGKSKVLWDLRKHISCDHFSRLLWLFSLIPRSCLLRIPPTRPDNQSIVFIILYNISSTHSVIVVNEFCTKNAMPILSQLPYIFDLIMLTFLYPRFIYVSP